MTRPPSPVPFYLQDAPISRAKKANRVLGEAVIHESPNESPPFSTDYMNMLLKLDKIPKLHNILAGAFAWLLLAGFVVIPGTFTSIVNSRTLQTGAGKAGKAVVKTVQNLPLLGVAAVCCLIGASGMSWLWWIYRSEYIWLISRLFLPGLLNSLAGFITTLVGVYGARGGFWSIIAIITAAVTGTSTSFMLVLYLIYDFWRLNEVKKQHRLAIEAERARLNYEKDT